MVPSRQTHYSQCIEHGVPMFYFYTNTTIPIILMCCTFFLEILYINRMSLGYAEGNANSTDLEHGPRARTLSTDLEHGPRART